MNYETYYIPANFTDAGKIFGIFEIRNIIEALLLGAPVLALCVRFLPFALTTKIIVTLAIFIPVAGFAMMGISGDSLSRYLRTLIKWRNARRILTYRGEIDYSGFERAYLRNRRQRVR